MLISFEFYPFAKLSTSKWPFTRLHS